MLVVSLKGQKEVNHDIGEINILKSLNRNMLLIAFLSNIILKAKMNHIKHRIKNPCLEENRSHEEFLEIMKYSATEATGV